MIVDLFRHTQVDVLPGQCYGRTDVPLAASAPQEMERALARAPSDYDVVYSSPLGRCVRLARMLHPQPILEPQLMELDFGDWEMQLWAQIEQTPHARAWFEDYVHVAPPNGESWAQMAARVGRAWQQLSHGPHERVALVAHAGTLRAILAHILEIPLERAMSLEFGKGSVSRVDVRPTHAQVLWINR